MENISHPNMLGSKNIIKPKGDWASVHWHTPIIGNVKINFDGASRGNPRKSGIGTCIRDYNGSILEIMVSPILDGTKNIVEAQALLLGLALVKKE